MKQVISSEKKPIKMWLTDIEEGALMQAKNIANLPFTFRHIAIMPDSHQGYGMPIGAVLATNKVIVPNAVGVDIGCGMCALKTNITDIAKVDLHSIINKAKQLIPVGFNWHEEKQDENLMPKNYENLEIVSRHYEKATMQIGTLGGGNHFIEIQKGNDGFIWIMIHSGSRNLGYNVAKHYDKLAQEINANYFSNVSKDMEMAFLPIHTKEAKDYFNEMNYCVEFALANRKLMMQRMIDAFNFVLGEFEFDDIINKSHNFAAWENHFKENVIVHRKGATRAYLGEYGMIPGSQGSKSFIVIGKGNNESFRSCSHGAGRKMGRKQAQRELNLADEIAIMNKLGVLHNIETVEQLDEATSAYKDIDVVMQNQSDLVDIVVELMPLAVIKG